MGSQEMKMKRGIPEEEYLMSGHLACAGCGATIAMRYALKALGEDVIVVIPACCWTIIPGAFPHTALKVSLYHAAFETAASTATGVKAGLEMKGDSTTTVLAWAGDGGTFDIGLQALSGAAERNDDFIYICYDNEAYMNTGNQRSSATPFLTWTTTTPVRQAKGEAKKNIMEIMAAHRIPYAATASVAYPEDFFQKMKKAKEIRGLKFIHILASCPTGWRLPSQLSIKAARLAALTRIFPLYEIENGEKYTINLKQEPRPVQEYLKLQGRFSHLTDSEIEVIQENVGRAWERLMKKAGD
ncbi:MAG: 3-methyl-2-oxobutanoate dehydrogenase subunit beta [Desulfobacterales bacterium]|jgi:pyruvate/2-oxoacid:ferredoxin oxidoreductase beta subunit|nr:3-methyl-2-oxobutanoate dehydrogenase subunit beta [Desulfobacterales bacterium]